MEKKIIFLLGLILIVPFMSADIAHLIIDSDVDTSSFTECSTDEVLLGNGSCMSSSIFGSGNISDSSGDYIYNNGTIIFSNDTRLNEDFNQSDKADYQFTNNNFNGSGNFNTTGNISADTGFFNLAWSYITNIPNLIRGIWEDKNVDGILISNGTAIGINQSALNNSIDVIANQYNETNYIDNLILDYYTKAEIDNNLSNYLLITDQRYNNTLLILNVNTTINNRIDGLGINNSFNQTLTDELYYSINNPSNFINLTTGQSLNDTTLILSVNTSLWSYINSNEGNWLSTYNATYSMWAYNQSLATFNMWNSTWDNRWLINNSWNESRANELYTNKTYVDAQDIIFNNSMGDYVDSENVNQTSWVNTFFLKIADMFTMQNILDMISGNRTESEATTNANILSNWTDLESRKLNITDQRFNDTLLIISVNSSLQTEILERIANDSFLQGQIDLIVSYNSSWNETYADTLYYSITNPSNFINLTTGQSLNDTTLIVSVNSSLWDYINTNEASWLSTYNSTYSMWAYNQTTATYNLYNDIWSSTYNATYDAKADYQFTDNNFNGSGNFNTTGNIQATTGFFNLAWSYLTNIPNLIYGIWTGNNVDGILISNGTAIGINGTAFNESVDARATIFNDSMASYVLYVNGTMKSYVDAQDINFNQSMFDYVNAQDVIFNDSIAEYVVLVNQSMAEYVLFVNSTSGDYTNSQDVIFNDSMTIYVNSQNSIYNLSMFNYVNSQDTLFNNSIATYVDAQISLLNYGDFFFANFSDSFNSNLTLAALQGILNSTGIYSTYNETYNIWAYNQTTETFSLYNSSWDNRGLIIIESNERIGNDSYLQGQIDSIISYNSTFNQSLTDSLYAPLGYGDDWNKTYADTLYYSISNPNNYINLTSGQVFNDTSLILVVNSSLWDYINTNEDNWLSTYNATYAGLINNESYLSTYNSTYDDWENNVDSNIDATGFNMTADTGFFNLAWSFLTDLPNLIYGLWDVNNVDGLLISNGTAIGINQSAFNESIDARATIFNESITSYINAQDIIFNDSMASYVLFVNGTMKAYVDAQDINFNSSMFTYVNAQDVIYNNSMRDYVILVNSSMASYVLDVNDSIISYVDAQDIIFNNSMTTYVNTAIANNMTISNLQSILNSTGIYSTYNSTYDDWENNVDSNIDATGFNMTADTGDFTFLGSILNRISNLWVNDADITNINSTNINVTGDLYMENDSVMTRSGTNTEIGIDSSGIIVTKLG